ncbi:sensor histidine kinase [Bifidobacterium parmae]|uniref:histidine kinase n=1 Tax=Bifidobacterium parmae TaxID=361854 RepID=A0A2N5IWT3_9BIFI|nr:histidine kinase [Bifidobacterium parmae]PLS26412.1 two-component system sensor histidine kinase [Bifidobacterium parmae]
MTNTPLASAGPVAAAFGRLAVFWRANPVARMTVPALCLAYDVMMLTRVVFVGPEADPHAGLLLRQPWGPPLLIVLCMASTGALLARPRHPFVAACVTCVAYLCAAPFDVQTYTAMPILFALYSCVVLCPVPYLVGGVAANATALVLGWLLPFRFPWEPWTTFLMPMAFLEAMTVALAAWSRGRRRRREAAAMIERERIRAVEAAAQRDAMEARARMSAELHDSVGHDLTAIIALAEGLKAVNTDGTMDEAIGMIATLGHQALDETRKVARSLNPVRSAGGGAVSGDAVADDSGRGLHGWGDPVRLLETVRAAGVDAVLTETGIRPHDAVQADLCFTVSREAVTNAMRHGREVTSIVVSWDHHADGSMTVTVRDDGKTTHGDGHDVSPRSHDGTGLTVLRERVARAGGTFVAGPSADGDGWTVTARLSAMTDGEERER